MAAALALAAGPAQAADPYTISTIMALTGQGSKPTGVPLP
jgi:hypothetical protein